jgi:hypothetical protein
LPFSPKLAEYLPYSIGQPYILTVKAAPSTQSMKILTRQIAKELTKSGHCGIYEPELSRVWPINERTREAEIARFARQHGWRLRFYKEGFCAIFDEDDGHL